MIRAALTALVAVLAAGCNSSAHSPAATTADDRVAPPPAVQPVPWLNSRVVVDNAVRTYVSLGSPAAPACTASELAVEWPLAMQGLSGDQIAGGFAIRNTGSNACTVTGVPTFRLVAATGAPIPLSEVERDQTLGRLAHWWGYPTVSLRPGEYATASVIGSLGCGPSAANVDLVLPGGDVGVPLRGRVGLRRPCNHPRDPVPLTAFLFVPEEAPPPPATPEPPLQVTLVAPRSVRPGELLRYRVTIGNGGTRSYRFPRCPVYWEGIRRELPEPVAPDDRRLHAFRLNCSVVRTLPPMTERTFAMVLRVPATTRPGRGLLVWSFVPDPLPASNYSIGSAPIQVVP